jgi:chemotaxis protein CheD
MTESTPVQYVGIGEMKFSDDPHVTLCASNLGSCVGVAVYDPTLKIGGMIHCLLPMSTGHAEKAKKNPEAFVDLGVVLLLQEALKRGSKREQLIITVAGGSNISDLNNVFEIGKKNYAVLRKVLWKNNLLIKAEHVGEGHSRTFSLEVKTGHSWVKIQGEKISLFGG